MTDNVVALHSETYRDKLVKLNQVFNEVMALQPHVSRAEPKLFKTTFNYVNNVTALELEFAEND